MEHTIKLNEIAKKIGNEPQEITLPNGQTRMSVNWDGPTAQAALKEVYPLSATGEKVVIDGPAPAWFVSALAHTVHPCAVGLNDPKIGVIDIPVLPKGELSADGHLAFQVTETKTHTILEVTIESDAVPPIYNHEDLSKVVLPEIPQGKPLYLSGRVPNYAMVAIGEGYAHEVPAIGYFQPQNKGYTYGISHTPEIHVGDFLSQDELNRSEITDKAMQAITSAQDTVEKSQHLGQEAKETETRNQEEPVK